MLIRWLKYHQLTKDGIMDLIEIMAAIQDAVYAKERSKD